MPRPRASILGLVAAVVASAVAFAALRTGSDYWASASYTILAVLLLYGLIAARYRPGPARPFWFGFAVFGWGFFLLGANPWSMHLGITYRGYGGGALNRNLLTTRLIQAVVVRVQRTTDDVEEINRLTANTVAVIQYASTLMIAVGGGLLASWMRAMKRRPSPGIGDRSSNLAALLMILTGLGAGALSWLDRPTPRYFPASVSRFDPSDTEADPYSTVLDDLEEPILSTLAGRDPKADVVRLLWWINQDHPITVRVVRTLGGARVRFAVHSGIGWIEYLTDDHGLGGIAIDRTVAIGPDRWEQLQGHLARAGFWAMTSSEDADNDFFSTSGNGEACVIEVVQSGRYHAVARSSGADGAYEDLGRFMLGLTGLNFQRAWKKYHDR